MPEIRDPAIKLFGRTIALHAAESGGGGGEKKEEDKGHLTSKDREQESPDLKESSEPVSSAEYDKGNHSSSDDQETAPENYDEEEEEEHNDSSNPMLKKPDKILPCPRCNSLETKFCYYNNYNVNQPRHFCKNCQRYWTAGGTMRNVPVGAGRRKNKNSAASSLYHHLTVSGVGHQSIPEQARHPPLGSNGTVLSFGSDAPFGDTMASVPNLPEKITTGCHRKEHTEERSSASPVTPSECNGTGGDVNVLPCQIPWTPPPPPPALCASSYPMPFYPAAAAYWGYNPWGLSLLSSMASPSPLGGWSVPGPDCAALGKHSREEEEDGLAGDSSSSSSSERRHRLWIPKTMRIHDAEAAAKSSIWASMGFKSDDGGGGQGFFKAFQTKGELSRTHLGGASSQALHANPAALSRSMNFLESS